jgi:hypothetical protein
VGRGRAGEPKEFRYRMFGQPQTEVQTTTYTPNILELELIVDGQSVWQRGGNFDRSFGISLMENETVDQALARINEAPVSFFANELPARVLPSSASAARRSKLTVSGVQ